MLKRIISVIIAAITVAACFAAAGCGEKKPDAPAIDSEYGCASYTELAETALELVRTGNTELMKKLMPEGAVNYNINKFRDKDQDYFELLKQDFDNGAARYDEACGEDWQISYEFTDVREKEAQQYRDYDGYYFKEYGMDPEKISAAVFIYADVTVTGSKGSFTKQKSCWTFCYEGRWYSFYIPSFGLYVAGRGE